MEQNRLPRKNVAVFLLLSLALTGLPGCGERDSSSPAASGNRTISKSAAAAGKMGSANALRVDRSGNRGGKGGGKNHPPSVTNKPADDVEVDSTYVYQPDVSDPDGDAVSFRIENRPSWLNWSSARGRLRGTPTEADIGPHSDIKIYVSDGKTETIIGPFTVAVIENPVDDDPPPTVHRKFNPGHYIAMNKWDDQSDMIDALRPGVRGIQKRYLWSDLETSINTYDFSAIESDLELLASQGSRLVVFLHDKSFNGVIPTPPYLRELTLENRAGGYTVKRWEPYVVERFTLLIDARGAQLDDHPAFEGIAIQESALGLEQDILDSNGYTPELYRDALIETITAARASLPRSQVFWYMNFLPNRNGYLADIANAAANVGVAMGGPDVKPDDQGLQRHAYPLYPDFRGKLTLFNSMQYNSYRHEHADKSYPTKYWTMSELFDYAVSELYVQYLFWNRTATSDPADSYNWTHALPVIAQTADFGYGY